MRLLDNALNWVVMHSHPLVQVIFIDRVVKVVKAEWQEEKTC